MGRLIAFEGIDGSGKGTQSAELVKRLSARGLRVERLAFPRYEATFFGGLIGQFLDGKLGDLTTVPPLFTALLYASDRVESKTSLIDALDANDVVVLDRYVASNVAHQSARLAGSDRDELIAQIGHVEHEIYALPRPDRTVLLDVPAETARTLIAKKAKRVYTAKEADLFESDLTYQREVRAVYRSLAEADDSWLLVPTVEAETQRLRDVAEIADEIETGLISSINSESPSRKA